MKVEAAVPSTGLLPTSWRKGAKADGSRCWCTAEDLDDLKFLQDWGSRAVCVRDDVALDGTRVRAIYKAFLPEEVALALSS